jgi:ComF family protein
MMRAGEELLAGADAVAPTPLHPRRLFGRRYNQAAEIARPLARLAKLRYAPDVLRRARPTPSQGGRSAVERRRNLVGAIVVDPARQPLVEGRRIVVIDDVFTTGATAEACAKALLRAGARAVDLLTVARVRDDASLTI